MNPDWYTPPEDPQPLHQYEQEAMYPGPPGMSRYYPIIIGTAKYDRDFWEGTMCFYDAARDRVTATTLDAAGAVNLAKDMNNPPVGEHPYVAWTPAGPLIASYMEVT